jgi:hypothetical protein
MKRLIVVVALLVAAALAGCQTLTVVGSTIVVEWDKPDLGSIPETEVSYEVYLAPYPGGLGTLLATVTSLEQPISFTAEGKYRIGVRTKRTFTGGEVFSPIAWSDVEGAPAPWYAAYYAAPPKVQRVRIQ